MIMGWLKNKAASTGDLEKCIDFLSNELAGAERERSANKVAMYIHVGLTRMKSEGMDPSFFQNIYKDGKNEATKKYGLTNCCHVEFAVPYVAMSLFRDLILSDTPNGRKGLVLILGYLNEYADMTLNRNIRSALGVENV